MTSTPSTTPTYRKQVNFLPPHSVSRNQRFRATFCYKGTVAGDILITAARNYPPYNRITGSAKTLKVSTQWQTECFEFSVNDSSPPPLAMPRFELGAYPQGATLYLGPVTLERIDKSYASLLSGCWMYQIAPEPELPTHQIPAAAVQAVLKDDTFDLAKQKRQEGDNLCAGFYQEFNAPSDGTMTLGASADWFFECYLNGKKEFSTFVRGNLSHKFVPQDNIFNVPVKKGRNLIAFKVRPGSKGWKFICGNVGVSQADPALSLIFKPEAGKMFRPVDDRHFLEVKRGSALDFSNLTERHRPAGKFGRLIVGATGKPVFEQQPASPVRFFAFNLMLGGGMWRERYHEWDQPTIDRFADAVERRGYNLVRIHTPENFLCGWDTMTKYRNVTLQKSQIPLTREALEKTIDKGNLDRLDYLIAALKKRGIYVNLDLAGRTMITRACRVEHEDSFKAHLFHDEDYRRHWKLFSEFLMARVNPYTQVPYKDEPAIMLIDFINEQDLRLQRGLKFLTPLFRNWLREKYATPEALSKAWEETITFAAVPDITELDLRRGDRRSLDTGDFLIATMREMTTWFYSTLRATGYKGLVNHWDMIIRMLELPGRALLPAVAQHIYFAHPGKLPPQGVIPKNIRPNSFVGNYDGDTTVDQRSSLDSSYFRAAAAARFFDRPYFITEYSHSSPNQFRHERGLYFAGYASLQDWDSLTAHGFLVRLHLDPFLAFDDALDPISRVNEALTALIYLRGDVRSAPHSVALKMESGKLFPKHYLAAIGDDYAKLSLVTRIGLLYPEIKPLEPVGAFSPDLILTPESFGSLRVSQLYVDADSTGSGKAPGLFQKLRDGGILSRSNSSDPAKERYVSETGELLLDGREKTLSVVTPRLEGAILKRDKSTTLGLATIRKCTRPAAVAISSLDRNATLAEADRLLLTFATNAFNTGQIFNNTAQGVCYESGNHPALIETAKLELALRNGRENAPDVWALHFDGTRAEKISAEQKNGELLLSLDTSKLKYGAAFFEISYEKCGIKKERDGKCQLQ